MRSWLLLLLLLPSGTASAPEALQEAADWLATQPASALSLSAAHAAGKDTMAWPDDPWLPGLEQPPPSSRPGSELRMLYALASSGYAHQVPAVAQRLQTLHDPILQAQRPADMAWWILSAHAAGLDALAPMATSLARSQQPDGFPCDVAPNPDCTGFAVVALAVTGVAFDRDAIHAMPYANGTYHPEAANADTQAWSILAMEHAGGDVPPAAWDWLLALQGDGWFRHVPGAAGLPATWLYPTTDAMLALGDFPGPAYAPLTITWQEGAWHALGDWNVTWTWQDHVARGASFDPHDLPGGTFVHVHAQRDGAHHRAVLEVPGALQVPTPAPAMAGLMVLVAAMLGRRARPVECPT